MDSKQRKEQKATLRHIAKIRVEQQLGERGIGSSGITKTMVEKEYKKLLGRGK